MVLARRPAESRDGPLPRRTLVTRGLQSPPVRRSGRQRSVIDQQLGRVSEQIDVADLVAGNGQLGARAKVGKKLAGTSRRQKVEAVVHHVARLLSPRER